MECQSDECRQLVEMIEKAKFFKIRSIAEWTDNRVVIDFRHITASETNTYYHSSVAFNKKTGCIEATVRERLGVIKNKNFKEFYLDYCCENGEMACRPHFDSDSKTASIEAHFCMDSMDRFKRLLNEFG